MQITPMMRNILWMHISMCFELSKSSSSQSIPVLTDTRNLKCAHSPIHSTQITVNEHLQFPSGFHVRITQVGQAHKAYLNTFRQLLPWLCFFPPTCNRWFCLAAHTDAVKYFILFLHIFVVIDWFSTTVLGPDDWSCRLSVGIISNSYTKYLDTLLHYNFMFDEK